MNDSTISPTEPAILARLGALLLDAGASVTDVRATLEQIGARAVRVGVLPELVIVIDSDERTALSSAEGELDFRQSARANQLARAIADGSLALTAAGTAIAAIRATAPTRVYGRWILSGAMAGGGLAVVFRCPWWAVVSSAIVGAVVGLLVVVLSRRTEGASIVPFVAAFCSTLAVGATADLFSFAPVPLFAVCAPIAVLVPGALITKALLELTAQDIITGSARLMFGLIQLGFMIAGIAAGAALTGLRIAPGSAGLVGDVAGVSATSPGWQAVGPLWTSWVGVMVVAVSVGIVFSAGRKLTLMCVAVMLCTYAVLVVLTPGVGSVVAAGIAATILFVVGRGLERLVAIPAAAFFQPAFLLLVPGTVGLVALASRDAGAVAIALETFASLCIGIKVGALIADVGMRNHSLVE